MFPLAFLTDEWYPEQTTRQGVTEAMGKLADPRRVKPEDRVLMYFSGHGQTVPIPRESEMGFLLPYDAKLDLNDVTNIPAIAHHIYDYEEDIGDSNQDGVISGKVIFEPFLEVAPRCTQGCCPGKMCCGSCARMQYYASTVGVRSLRPACVSMRADWTSRQVKISIHPCLSEFIRVLLSKESDSTFATMKTSFSGWRTRGAC